MAMRSLGSRVAIGTAASLAAASLAVFHVRAAESAGVEWNRFRGPNGSGVAEAGALPAAFSPTTNVAWKTPLPPGHSSPIVYGDRVFLTAFEGEALLTVALDRKTGRELWRREAPRPRKEKIDKRNSPASPSPVADASGVYVFFSDYGLIAYDLAGRERWRTPLGPFNNVYGMGASPILAGDSVVLACDQSQGSFVAAFAMADGRERWRVARPEALSGHATPILHEAKGGALQVLTPSSFRMDAYALSDGKPVWWVTGLPSEMKSGAVLLRDMVLVSGFSTPENDPGKIIRIPPFADVLAKSDADRDGFLSLAESPDARAKMMFPFNDLDGDGRVSASEWRMYGAASAAENGLLAFRIGDRGDATSALAWKYQRSVPQLPTVLAYRDVIYMINEGGVLTTLDPATGALKKQSRLREAVDSYYASPVAGDGKVYFCGLSGVVAVLEAGHEQQVLAVNQLDAPIYATPALSHGHVLIRTANAMYSFGSAAGAPR